MKSPKDKPKQKPKNLGAFKESANPKQKPGIDFIGAVSDYIEKDAKAFAKDPVNNLGRTAYDMTVGLAADPLNALYDEATGDSKGGWTNEAIFGLSAIDALDFTDWTKPITNTMKAGLKKIVSPKKAVSDLAETDIRKSSNFKNWFGDWESDPKNASKIVDKNGRPLVVYHGSQSGDITAFKQERKRRTGQWAGTYTTNDPAYANSYATNNRADFFTEGNPQIYPLYLDMKNPLMINEDEGISDEIKKLLNVQGDLFVIPKPIKKMQKALRPLNNGLELMLELPSYLLRKKNTPYGDIIYNNYQDVIHRFKHNIPANHISKNYYTNISLLNEDVKNQIEKLGYDGIIYNNGLEYVTFKPNQVKSAIGNSGKFSKKNDDIIGMNSIEQDLKDILSSKEDYA